MGAKPVALQKNKAGTNWPIPTAAIVTYKRNLRSSRGEGSVYLSDPIVLKKSDDRISGEVKDDVFKIDSRREQVKAALQVKF